MSTSTCIQLLCTILFIFLITSSDCFSLSSSRRESFVLSMSRLYVDVNKSSVEELLETVTIVGGGIAGLATAAALRNIAGIKRVGVLEKSSQMEFESITSGAGVQLGPNGLCALHAIGGNQLLEQVLSLGSKLKGNSMMIPGSPEPIFIPDTAEVDTGFPQVFIQWGLLRKLLSDLVPNDSIQFGIGDNICGYQTLEDGNVQILERNESMSIDSLTCQFDKNSLVVGADGCFSVFRYLVNNSLECIPEELDIVAAKTAGIKFTGRVNIKAIVSRALGSKFSPGTTYSFFASDGSRIGCFAGPAGQDKTYWAISLAEDSIDFLNDNGPTDPEVMKAGLLSKLASLQSNDCQFAINLIEDTSPGLIYVTKSAEAIKIGPSLESNSKIVLVGDSAHAMSGSYGQNPNFALEDAVVLAKCIKDEPSVSKALKIYSQLRVDRCLEMQRRSSERAIKSMKGEESEDVSKWIFRWTC